MTETALRYASAIAVSFVVIVIAITIGISVYRGIGIGSPQLVPLLATVGTLTALVVSLLRTGQVAASSARTEQLVNGHLAQHVGHTDEKINQMIDQRVAELLSVPPAAPPPPPPTAPGGQ